MPRSPDPDLRKLWQVRLARYCQSELTVAEFCRREGVSQANFFVWKKRLGKSAVPPAPPVTAVSAKFLPLLVTGRMDAATATLRLPGGTTIDLPANLDREQLTELLVACIAASRQTVDAEAQQ